MTASIEEIINYACIALKASGYEESTITEYRKQFERLRVFAEKRGERVYTSETGALFKATTAGIRTKCFCRYTQLHRKRCVDMFDHYIGCGDFGIGEPKVSNTAHPATKVYRDMHEDFLTSLVQDGKSKNTIDSFRNVSCKYFLFLESSGVTSLESATEETVHGFLSCIRETWAEGSLRTALSALRSLFRHTGQADLLETADHIRPIRTHRIIPVLTEQEECLLWNALEKSGDISKRDKAIVLLCLITGLRACDVTRLRTSDINWHTDTISVVQQKTGNPLSIPLLPALGNAIAEYMISERPANREEILFLSKNCPHGPLAGHTPCRAIILRTLRIAGISLDGRICGTRLLRHNAASKMLRSEIPIETISAVLGHSAPDSTEIYLATDESRMRECCLSIPTQSNMEDEKR